MPHPWVLWFLEVLGVSAANREIVDEDPVALFVADLCDMERVVVAREAVVRIVVAEQVTRENRNELAWVLVVGIRMSGSGEAADNLKAEAAEQALVVR